MKDWIAVPKEPGAFLWMRRREPGPGREKVGQEVLFTGSTRNLRRRLHSFSSGSTASDVTLQRLFEVIIAPALRPELLQKIVVDRRSLSITQMWVRDHVVFAYATVTQFAPGLIEGELYSPSDSGMDFPMGLEFGSPPSLRDVLTDLNTDSGSFFSRG